MRDKGKVMLGMDSCSEVHTGNGKRISEWVILTVLAFGMVVQQTQGAAIRDDMSEVINNVIVPGNPDVNAVAGGPDIETIAGDHDNKDIVQKAVVRGIQNGGVKDTTIKPGVVNEMMHKFKDAGHTPNDVKNTVAKELKLKTEATKDKTYAGIKDIKNAFFNDFENHHLKEIKNEGLKQLKHGLSEFRDDGIKEIKDVGLGLKEIIEDKGRPIKGIINKGIKEINDDSIKEIKDGGLNGIKDESLKEIRNGGFKQIKNGLKQLKYGLIELKDAFVTELKKHDFKKIEDDSLKVLKDGLKELEDTFVKELKTYDFKETKEALQEIKDEGLKQLKDGINELKGAGLMDIYGGVGSSDSRYHAWKQHLAAKPPQAPPTTDIKEGMLNNIHGQRGLEDLVTPDVPLLLLKMIHGVLGQDISTLFTQQRPPYAANSYPGARPSVLENRQKTFGYRKPFENWVPVGRPRLPPWLQRGDSYIKWRIHTHHGQQHNQQVPVAPTWSGTPFLHGIGAKMPDNAGRLGSTTVQPRPWIRQRGGGGSSGSEPGQQQEHLREVVPLKTTHMKTDGSPVPSGSNDVLDGKDQAHNQVTDHQLPNGHKNDTPHEEIRHHSDYVLSVKDKNIANNHTTIHHLPNDQNDPNVQKLTGYLTPDNERLKSLKDVNPPYLMHEKDSIKHVNDKINRVPVEFFKPRQGDALTVKHDDSNIHQPQGKIVEVENHNEPTLSQSQSNVAMKSLQNTLSTDIHPKPTEPTKRQRRDIGTLAGSPKNMQIPPVLIDKREAARSQEQEKKNEDGVIKGIYLVMGDTDKTKGGRKGGGILGANPGGKETSEHSKNRPKMSKPDQISGQGKHDGKDPLPGLKEGEPRHNAQGLKKSTLNQKVEGSRDHNKDPPAPRVPIAGIASEDGDLLIEDSKSTTVHKPSRDRSTGVKLLVFLSLMVVVVALFLFLATRAKSENNLTRTNSRTALYHPNPRY